MDDAHSGLVRELSSYLDFFRKRQELERDYADNLRKLSLKAAQADKQLDDELPSHILMSWRKAWLSVRATVEDEARVHRQTADGLERIVSTLGMFRDNRDRIRRRIADDLRLTAQEHSDYKSVVSRLRKSYERKVEELQHHEEAEALKEEAPPPPPSTSTGAGKVARGNGAAPGGGPGAMLGSGETWPPEHWACGNGGHGNATPAYLRKRSDSAASSKGGGTLSNTASDAETSPPGSVISPAPTPSLPSSSSHSAHPPVFVSGATSSASGPKEGPYRDPPGTGKQNVFEAIAKRDWSGEKHRVNSIVRAVGNLAKGQDAGVGGGRAERGMRARQYGGRLKREAEQADRDYRAGIFQLETLRLQKVRVQSSARESLREFVLELGSTLKTAFEQRVADQISLGHSQVAIGEHVKPELSKLDAPHDVEQFLGGVQDSAKADAPVYYVNAFVGECRYLIFGVGLQDYTASHPTLLVPLIVQRCIASIDSHGLDVEGIYRISGKLATIQQLVTRMEKNEDNFQFGPQDDPPAVSGVLKLFLRQLPVPLFPFSASDRKNFVADYGSSPETATAALIRRLRRLSPPQQATLKALCEHLARVAAHEAVNKMGVSNLALIFSTVVFGEEEAASLEAALHTTKDVAMELLIEQHAHLFEGLPAEPPALSRSRRPSGNLASLVPPPPSTSAPSSSQTGSVTSLQSSPPSSNPSAANSPQPAQHAQMPPASAPMRHAGSIDSVYALYQRAAAPGALSTYSSSSPDSSPDAPKGFVPPPPSSSRHYNPTLLDPQGNRIPPHLRPTAVPLVPPATAPLPVVVLTPMSERSETSFSGAAEEGEEGGRRSGPVSPSLASAIGRGEDGRPPLPPRRSTVHDLDSPSPPLTAAMGRRVLEEEEP
ncbi:hypothetical protein JCM8547_006222 [Rhodosporidiobolus lusitaniae]